MKPIGWKKCKNQKPKRVFGFSFLSDQLDRPNARFWLSKISFQKRVFVDDIFHPVWWEKIKSKTKTRFCFSFLLDRLDRPYSGVGLSLIFPHKFGNNYHDFVLKEYSWAKSRIIENNVQFKIFGIMAGLPFPGIPLRSHMGTLDQIMHISWIMVCSNAHHNLDTYEKHDLWKKCDHHNLQYPNLNKKWVTCIKLCVLKSIS